MMERLIEDPNAQHTPIEIKLKTREKRLEVQFENGQTFWYPAEYLRVEAPAADGNIDPMIPGRRHVGIVDVEAQEPKSLRIKFDDGYEEGVFSWEYLYWLGKNYESRWKEYLRGLDEKGLSREP